MIALYFTVFPKEAKNFITEAQEYEKEEKKREQEEYEEIEYTEQKVHTIRSF